MSTAARIPAALVDGGDNDPGDPLLELAERVALERLGWRQGSGPAIEAARERARSLAAVGVGALGPVILLSEVVTALCQKDGIGHEDLSSLVDATAEATGVPRDAFGLQLAQSAIAGRPLLELPAERTLERALSVLMVIAPMRQVSLWEVDETGKPRCAAHAGQFPSKRTAELARYTLEGRALGQSSALLVGLPLTRKGYPAAALMARPKAGERQRCTALLSEVAPLLGGLLERSVLAKRAATTERVLAETTERRLARLAFDVHDGPLQNVAGIAGDLRRLRRRLHGTLSEPQARLEVLGCVDDLDARLDAIDTELRDMSHSLESPKARSVPFTRMLQVELEAFRRRTEIRLSIEIHGDFDDVTESQRIALWRIMQESLTNAREHSGAREVRVEAVATDDRLALEVTDDGRGFDVPATLLAAAKRGRLGLVGVSERVRLLGGSCEVRSAPGGPTTISVGLPRWRPQT